MGAHTYQQAIDQSHFPVKWKQFMGRTLSCRQLISTHFAVNFV